MMTKSKKSGYNPMVRIYLFTYQRPDTIERALSSLLAQDYPYWVCELHNDDPEDYLPRQLVSTLKDPRVTYVHHSKNFGAVETFNMAFKPVKEPFISILEDDNWWEANFLSTMVATMMRYKQVTMSWANMHVWKETGTGKWEQTGTIWPLSSSCEETLFDVPDPRQACGALHSNGAMLVRTSQIERLVVPASLPFFAIEPVRERIFPPPLLLVGKPLANFAITKSTARSESADENLQIMVLLALTFIKNNSQVKSHFYRDAWLACRGSRGHKLRALTVAFCLAGKPGLVWKSASLGDLIEVLLWMALHPKRTSRILHAKAFFPEVYSFLKNANSLMYQDKEGLV